MAREKILREIKKKEIIFKKNVAIEWALASYQEWDLLEKWINLSTEVDLNLLHEGLTFGWLLAFHKQWALLKHCRAKSDNFDLDAMAPLHHPNRGITIAWMLAKNKQEELLKICLAKNPMINFNATPLDENDPERGITVAWFMVKFHLYLFNCSDLLFVELDAAPLDKTHSSHGISLAFLLAEQEKWDLLMQWIELNTRVNLNAAKEKLTLAWILAFNKQWLLLERCLALSPKINLNTCAPSHNGVTVAWLLTYHKQWDILEACSKQSAVNLDAMPIAESNQQKGMSIAWLLCFYANFDLLSKLFKTNPKMNLHAVPPTLPNSSILKELIFRKQWVILRDYAESKGVTLPFLLAKNGEWKCLDQLIESKTIIDLNHYSQIEDELIRGISLFWLLINYGLFNLIYRLLDSNPEAKIDLNIAPLHEKHDDVGVTIAWQLAFRQDFKLLSKLFRLNPYINLTARPLSLDHPSKGKTLLQLLIESNNWDLLKEYLIGSYLHSNDPLEYINEIRKIHSSQVNEFINFSLLNYHYELIKKSLLNYLTLPRKAKKESAENMQLNLKKGFYSYFSFLAHFNETSACYQQTRFSKIELLILFSNKLPRSFLKSIALFFQEPRTYYGFNLHDSNPYYCFQLLCMQEIIKIKAMDLGIEVLANLFNKIKILEDDVRRLKKKNSNTKESKTKLSLTNLPLAKVDLRPAEAKLAIINKDEQKLLESFFQIIETGEVEQLKNFLKDKNASLIIDSYKPDTPAKAIDVAAVNYHFSMLDYLLENGAALNRENSKPSVILTLINFANTQEKKTSLKKWLASKSGFLPEDILAAILGLKFNLESKESYGGLLPVHYGLAMANPYCLSILKDFPDWLNQRLAPSGAFSFGTIAWLVVFTWEATLLENNIEKMSEINLNAAPLCNGISLGYLLAMSNNWKLLSLCLKKNYIINLDNGPKSKGTTLAWELAKEKQWELLRTCLAQSKSINLDAELHINSANHGYTVALILAINRKWELLSDCLLKASKINLNKSIENKKSAAYGITLAWVLAVNSQWGLLSQCLDKSDAIDLNSTPPKTHKDSGLSVAGLLIFSNHFELLSRAVNKSISVDLHSKYPPDTGKPLSFFLAVKKQWQLLSNCLKKSKTIDLNSDLIQRLLEDNQWNLLGECILTNYYHVTEEEGSYFENLKILNSDPRFEAIVALEAQAELILNPKVFYNEEQLVELKETLYLSLSCIAQVKQIIPDYQRTDEIKIHLLTEVRNFILNCPSLSHSFIQEITSLFKSPTRLYPLNDPQTCLQLMRMEIIIQKGDTELGLQYFAELLNNIKKLENKQSVLEKELEIASMAKLIVKFSSIHLQKENKNLTKLSMRKRKYEEEEEKDNKNSPY